METMYSFFKTPTSELTKRQGQSSGQVILQSTPSLPSVLKSPESSTPNVFTDSQPSSSLVQKLAARFVVPVPQYNDVKDRRALGSRGGNSCQSEVFQPACRKTLYSQPPLVMKRMDMTEVKKPVQTASQVAEKEYRREVNDFYKNMRSLTSAESSVLTKSMQSTLFMMIFMWLINQRQLMRDLSALKGKQHQEQKLLERKQGETQTEVMTLSQHLQLLYAAIQRQQKENKSEMVLIRRLVVFCGLVNLFCILTVLYWSNNAVQKLFGRWLMTVVSDVRQRLKFWR